jgi:collagenase-like PrtC family protease
MRLSVAANFDPRLLDAVKGTPVVELFGKLQEDAVGGGRAPYQLAPVSRNRLALYVRLAREAGIEFNYLLNASCLGNREITRTGRKEIESLCGWLTDIGVASVTVASPYLLRLVKTRFRSLKTRISVFGGVDRVRKAQQWEEMGADCIVLDNLLVNRELKTLERIRRSVSCELELLVNNNCLSNCAFAASHMNALAHAGQPWHANRGAFIDWCFLACTEMKLRDPVNYLRSEWIRPEDLPIYEGMGYDRFKIAERNIPTPVMAARVRAYAERRYEGNLLDLVQPYAFAAVRADDRYYRHGPGWFLRYLLRQTMVHPRRMLVLKRLADTLCMTRPVDGDPPVYIDNRALDGFMERFRESGCRDTDCRECRWCHDFAARSIRIDEAKRDRALEACDILSRSFHGDDRSILRS